MIWNDHSRDIPQGSHAFLGASKYSWLNYDEEKLEDVWKSQYARMAGTVLHELASKLIANKIKLSYSDKHLVLLYLLDNNVPHSVINIDKIMDNLVPYVKDGIGFRMVVEQPLKYSDNVFGTADAIIFDEKKKFLRIHDYKSGDTPASLKQLEIYASLFCLEYDYKPGELEYELRIYQNGEILVGNPTAKDILPTIDKIVTFDRLIEEFKEAG